MKSWYKSKTKWGGIVGAVGLLLPAISQGLSTGDWSALPGAVVQAGALLLSLFGVRDALADVGEAGRGR